MKIIVQIIRKMFTSNFQKIWSLQIFFFFKSYLKNNDNPIYFINGENFMIDEYTILN